MQTCVNTANRFTIPDHLPLLNTNEQLRVSFGSSADHISKQYRGIIGINGIRAEKTKIISRAQVDLLDARSTRYLNSTDEGGTAQLSDQQ